MARRSQPGTAPTLGAATPPASVKAVASCRWVTAGPVGACHTLFHSAGVCAAWIMAAARSGTYVKECGWSALPITSSLFPASTAGTMRSPAWEVRTRGPKKSPATTLTVFVREAARAFSSAVRTPRLPPCASRGLSSAMTASGSAVGVQAFRKYDDGARLACRRQHRLLGPRELPLPRVRSVGGAVDAVEHSGRSGERLDQQRRIWRRPRASCR